MPTQKPSSEADQPKRVTQKRPRQAGATHRTQTQGAQAAQRRAASPQQTGQTVARKRPAQTQAKATSAQRRPQGAQQRRSSQQANRTPQHSAARQGKRSHQVGYTSAAEAHRASSGRRAARASHGMPAWGIALVAVLVVGLSVGGFFLVRRFLLAGSGSQTVVSDVPAGQQVTVSIPDGSSGSQIVSILTEAGVVQNADEFRQAVKQQNADQSLRSGTYSFVTGSDPADVVRQLVSGPNSSEGQLKLPEGLTMTQTAEIVESSLGISQDEFLEQAKASNYADEYPFIAEAGNDSLEGFLYPKTYDLAGKEATADTVIRLMLDQYAQEAASLDFESAKADIAKRYNLTATDYDILKIASIIEKEAINEDDRSKVSSVFYNRLKQGMRLQSDATMMYVTGGAVSAEDLKTESPYNTYLNAGLPPTPICSPSLWALQAALEPADTPYLYFFIIEDGDYSNHTFSETFEEHDSAYAAALAEQAAQQQGSSSEGE